MSALLKLSWVVSSDTAPILPPATFQIKEQLRFFSVQLNLGIIHSCSQSHYLSHFSHDGRAICLLYNNTQTTKPLSSRGKSVHIWCCGLCVLMLNTSAALFFDETSVSDNQAELSFCLTSLFSLTSFSCLFERLVLLWIISGNWCVVSSTAFVVDEEAPVAVARNRWLFLYNQSHVGSSDAAASSVSWPVYYIILRKRFSWKL